ncbi:hypothetical protein C1H46_039626 [Malus baccata]|uniref:Uncharacterized protein n=1 Tax=Malus baccata TaxID=106549 RepID=A0A540KKU7_MALBA|nr:hypothetical protein C1H46_039626 [Malus baccata]
MTGKMVIALSKTVKQLSRTESCTNTAGEPMFYFLSFCRFTVDVKKMEENRHSFSCRFPQTVPNVDAQNQRS